MLHFAICGETTKLFLHVYQAIESKATIIIESKSVSSDHTFACFALSSNSNRQCLILSKAAVIG